MNAIAVAAKIIISVLYERQSLTKAYPDNLPLLTKTTDLAFTKMLVFGLLRHYFALDALAQQLLKKPLPQKSRLVYILMLLGLYQLRSSDRPDYACVSETVNAARALKSLWAVKLINAVLRNYLRQKDVLEANLNSLTAKYNHPQWLIEKVKLAWPNEWQVILEQNNAHPLFSCRVNCLKTTLEQYLQTLQRQNLIANVVDATEDGFILEKPVNVEKLPGFMDGLVSIQDIGAQLAAPLLDLKPGMRVLDACAAPGGKTTHILTLAENINLIALDHDSARLDKVKENLARLNLNAEIVCADAMAVKTWWDGQLFDRILLDAPCSGTGVIRRHPDIKHLRKRKDITKLATQQLQLLTTLWSCLKPGGVLLYVTCSILPEENQVVVTQFLQQHNDAAEVTINNKFGTHRHPGLQLLPSSTHDGFYYAKLLKAQVHG